MVSADPHHYYVPANDKTVHWGYFSKLLKPLVEINSGDFVTIESLTHHANDDAERMVTGDAGAESVFFWDNSARASTGEGPGRCSRRCSDAGRAKGWACTSARGQWL